MLLRTEGDRISATLYEQGIGSMPSPPPLVSVLIVNYNTAALARRCVASLQAQNVRREDGTAGVEAIVVDNASRPEERRALDGLDARVIYNDDNRGYGAALNQALAYASSEFILFSNADVWYFPGALQALLDHFLSLPRCGAVGPRLWWDLEREFLLPPSDPVTLVSYFQETAALRWSPWRSSQTHRWLRNAVQYWQSQQPLAQPMLSGACILTRRDVLAACGGFDERFRLYYEDTDWCRRIRQKGYQLYYVPSAEVTHLYNQSARQETLVSQQAGGESATYYFAKHYGAWLWRLVSWATGPLRAGVHHTEALAGYTDLGSLVEPPRLTCSTGTPNASLFLLSPLPSCVPAIARFLPAPAVSLLSAVWEQLGEGSWYAQLLSLPDLQPLERWHWEKPQS